LSFSYFYYKVDLLFLAQEQLKAPVIFVLQRCFQTVPKSQRNLPDYRYRGVVVFCQAGELFDFLLDSNKQFYANFRIYLAPLGKTHNSFEHN